MDREPVTIPAEATLLDAQEQFFLRYRWPWFAVVDPARHFLGVVRQQRVEAEIAAGRPALPVATCSSPTCRCGSAQQAPLESLLGSEGSGGSGRWWRSTATACCRASSRSPRCARRCARPVRPAERRPAPGPAPVGRRRPPADRRGRGADGAL